MATLEGSRWATTLTTETPDPILDLDDYVGQRAATFRFDIVDSVTGYRETVTPLRDTVPILSHDTARTITRQIMGLFLGVADTALFNSITSRLEPFMVFADGGTYPLGRYVPNNQVFFQSTAGEQSSVTFYDESFIVDQPFSSSFGSSRSNEVLQETLIRCLEGLPITYTIESSQFGATAAWSAGTRRGYAVEQIAIDGDWMSPWFDNNNIMRFIRSFDPATREPTFDLDSGNKVKRDKVLRSNDVITAPNQFVVVSNGQSGIGVNSGPVVGVYNVPDSAPHSALNRGFVLTETQYRQLSYSSQAQAVAESLGQKQIIFETIELQTAPDPRHDGYDVLRWQGANWLEIAWSLPMIEGSDMQHVARRAYL